MPLRVERLNARDVLESVRQRFAWRADAEGRALTIDAPDNLMIDADRLRLEQALGNLLDNALRHGAGAVTLAAWRAERAVELHVCDEGTGFPPQFLPRAFQRFGQADESRSGEGAGLGLAIVETIARAHHGAATVTNRPGGGADAAICLRVAGEAAGADTAAGRGHGLLSEAVGPSRR